MDEGLTQAADEQPMYGVGHNSIAAGALADIRVALIPFAARRDEIIQRADAFVEIRDRVDAGQAADILGVGKGVGGLIEAERRKIAEPHSEAVRVVGLHYDRFWAPANAALARLKERVDAFAREDDRRVQELQAEQHAEDQRRRAALAGPSPAPPAPVVSSSSKKPRRQVVRGDLGHAVLVGDKNVVELEDPRQLPDFIFQATKVKEAIEATAKTFVDKGITVSGVRVTKETQTSVRK